MLPTLMLSIVRRLIQESSNINILISVRCRMSSSWLSGVDSGCYVISPAWREQGYSLRPFWLSRRRGWIDF
jgi:hypothetical protein